MKANGLTEKCSEPLPSLGVHSPSGPLIAKMLLSYGDVAEKLPRRQDIVSASTPLLRPGEAGELHDEGLRTPE